MLSRPLVLLCAIAISAVGCHAPAPVQPTELPSAPRVPASLHVARLLPADTAALLVAPDPLRLVDRLGRRELIGADRELYERALARVVDETDHNLLTPAGLREVGIDPRRPAGAAWLGPVRRAGVIFVTLAAPERFKTAIYRAARARDHRVEPTVVEAGLVLQVRGEDQWAMALLDGMAVAVLSDGPVGAPTLARQLCSEPADGVLVDHEPFRAAVAALPGQNDLFVYADVGLVLRWLVGLDPRWPGASFDAAATALERVWSKRLARARAVGAPIEELLGIDEELRSARQQLQGDPEAERLRALVGSFGTAAAALEVLPNGVRARGQVLVEPGSLVARLWHNRSAVPVFADRLRQRPALLIQTTCDVQVALDVVAAAVPKPAELDERLGVDLTAELRAVLDGNVGIAVFHPLRLSDSPAKKPLGLAVWVGVRDEARARALLQKLTQAASLRDLLRRAGDGYSLDLGDHLGAAQVEVSEGALVLTTAGAEPHWGKASGSPGPWRGVGHALVRRVARASDVAFDTSGALGLWSAWDQDLGASGDGGARLPEPAPAEATHAVQTNAAPELAAPARPATSAPVSSADTERLEVSIGELDRRIERLERSMARRSLEDRLSLARRLGVVALSGRRTTQGLEWTAGWVVGEESLPALVTVLAGLLTAAGPDRSGDEQRWSVAQELLDERARLADELAKARERAAAAPSEPSPSGEPPADQPAP